MSRSEIRAKLCAGKIDIDSSIQAQRAGEVMGQNWRGYGNSYSRIIAGRSCKQTHPFMKLLIGEARRARRHEQQPAGLLLPL